MKIPAGRGFTIEIEQPSGTGAAWVVRTFRKLLFLRRLVSSDWFLDEAQAMRFGEQLAKELADQKSAAAIRSRNPGWTLHRAPH